MVLVVDDDAAMRRWKARFVRSDYGSKSSPRRMAEANLAVPRAASLLRNIALSSSPNAS